MLKYELVHQKTIRWTQLCMKDGVSLRANAVIEMSDATSVSERKSQWGITPLEKAYKECPLIHSYLS